MTPKEKADELYSKYDDLLNKDFMNPIVFDNQLKQCVLIAIEEIIKFGNKAGIREPMMYWNKVEQEIDRL
jgi:hypothetical protein